MTLTWRRFVCPDDEKGDLVVELATDGTELLELKARRGQPPRAGIRVLASPEQAARALDKRAAALLGKDHYEDGTRTGPRPLQDDAAAERAEKEEVQRLARAAFADGLPRFVAAWRQLGYDPRLTFHAQSARTTALPNALAERCLAEARAAFGVGFERHQQGYQGEHGMGRPIPIKPVEVAAFYVSPPRVAAIARLRLAGRLRGHDGAPPDLKGGGWDHYGVEDEVRAAIEALLAGA